MPIYKRCSRCGKRMSAGTICGCQKRRYQEEDKYTKDDKYKLFYKSRSWNRARDIAIDFYGGLDIYSLYVLGRMEYGQTMHHIIPLKECWERRTDVSNLIYLTESNHQIIHNIMAQGETQKQEVISLLLSLVERYRQEMSRG